VISSASGPIGAGSEVTVSPPAVRVVSAVIGG
jgi:hypothetical protein